MATYAPKTYAGTTDIYEYLITIDYARKDDIRVYIDDVLITRGSGAGKWQFSTSGTKIIFEDGSEPQDGETLIIRRVTDISDASVVYTAGSGFVYSDINLALNQLLYAVDELQVPGWEQTFTLAELDAGDIDTAHGLGGTPTRVEYILKNTSTDQGYGPNNEIPLLSCDVIPTLLWTSTVFATFSDEWDAINVHKGTVAGRGNLSVDKWSLIVRAWR
jgi:hypothetical protein